MSSSLSNARVSTVVLPVCRTPSLDSIGISASESKARVYGVSSIGCLGVVL